MVSTQEIQPRNKKPSAVVFVSPDTETQPEQLKLRLEQGTQTLKVRQARLLREVLSQRQPQLIVVPVVSPARTLSRMIAETGNPDRALDQWIGATESFLKTLRKSRQRILLISLEDALRDPDYMAEAIAGYAGVVFEPPEEEAAAPREEPAGSALDVFAQALLETHPAARETLETLDALVLSAEGLTVLTPDAAAAGCAAFLALLKGAGLSAEAGADDAAVWELAQEKTAHEHRLAREAVQSLQQEIETQVVARKAAEERQAASARALEAAQAETQGLREALAAAERQQAETGQALEAAQAETQALADKLAGAAAELEAARAAGEAERQARVDAEGRYALLGETFAEVKAELEVQFTAGKALEQELAGAEEALVGSRAEAEGLRAALEAQQLAGEAAAEKLAGAEAALTEARAAAEEADLLKAELETRLAAEADDRKALAEAEARGAAQREELDLARGTLELLQQELAAQGARIAQDAETIGTLQAERGDLLVKSAMHDAQEKQIQALRARAAQREAVLGAEVLQGADFSVRLSREIDALRQQLAEAQAAGESRVRALEAELTRVYGSRSWRVTEPLRGTSRTLRGKPGSDERA